MRRRSPPRSRRNSRTSSEKHIPSRPDLAAARRKVGCIFFVSKRNVDAVAPFSFYLLLSLLLRKENTLNLVCCRGRSFGTETFLAQHDSISLPSFLSSPPLHFSSPHSLSPTTHSPGMVVHSPWMLWCLFFRPARACRNKRDEHSYMLQFSPRQQQIAAHRTRAIQSKLVSSGGQGIKDGGPKRSSHGHFSNWGALSETNA